MPSNPNPDAIAGLREFAAIDRRCRTSRPTAVDFAARAVLFDLAGDREAARRDIRSALEADPTNPSANGIAIELLDEGERAQAAARIVAGYAAAPTMLRAAIGALLRFSPDPVRRLRTNGAGVRGWLAWPGNEPAALELVSGGVKRRIKIHAQSAHPLAGEGYSVCHLDVEPVDVVMDARDGACLFRREAQIAYSDVRAPAPPGAVPLTVIVPIYAGFEATLACLESLFEQEQVAFSVILVDDASPDAHLATLVRDTARLPGVTALRNVRNLGFAASVNRALALCANDDVLLLNADCWLPSRAVARLRALVNADASIGTATPLSNNGQIVSFPRPYVENATPSALDAEAIDAVAERSNGAAAIDIPSGVGFCLYVKRACLEAVGPLPEHYGRGYYEDVEFCWRAAQKGFRNVCAAGIFVAHRGAESFGSDKRELAARNLEVLARRFPARNRDYFAFITADPLRAARSAIEARTPSPDGITILLASEGMALWQAARRAREIERAGGAAWICAFRRHGGRVEFRRPGAGAPASLSFALDAAGVMAMRDYLELCDVATIEAFDLVEAPDALIEAMFGLGAPIDLMGIDFWAVRGPPQPRTWPCASAGDRCLACERADDDALGRDRPARLSRALAAARSIRPLDRMGDAFARRVLGARAGATWLADETHPATRPPVSVASRRLGVLAPIPSLESDRIALRLARRLARPAGALRLVVFGASRAEEGLVDTGAALATGPVKLEEYPALLRRYDVGRLAVLDRRGPFGPLDAAARELGVAKAYFDASFGAMATEPGDLAIDPRVCDEKAAAAVAGWLDSDPGLVGQGNSH